MAEAPAQPTPRNLVSVRNVGEENFEDRYNGRRYVIQAGKDLIVEVEAACCWLGYPGLRDEPERAVYRRRDSFNRLRRRWGFHSGRHSESEWEAMRPKLEVYTLDGERVWMILDDPKGDRARPETVSRDDVTFLREQYERQERELDALRQKVQAREAVVETPPEEIPEDAPRRVPVGARRGSSKG